MPAATDGSTAELMATAMQSTWYTHATAVNTAAEAAAPGAAAPAPGAAAPPADQPGAAASAPLSQLPDAAEWPSLRVAQLRAMRDARVKEAAQLHDALLAEANEAGAAGAAGELDLGCICLAEGSLDEADGDEAGIQRLKSPAKDWLDATVDVTRLDEHIAARDARDAREAAHADAAAQLLRGGGGGLGDDDPHAADQARARAFLASRARPGEGGSSGPRALCFCVSDVRRCGSRSSASTRRGTRTSGACRG